MVRLVLFIIMMVTSHLEAQTESVHNTRTQYPKQSNHNTAQKAEQLSKLITNAETKNSLFVCCTTPVLIRKQYSKLQATSPFCK